MNAIDSLLIAGLGGVLSFLASYVPGWNTWYAKQDETIKKLVMLGILLVVAIFLYASSCAGWWQFVACSEEGLKELIAVFVSLVVGNQAAYKILPTPRAVYQAKEAAQKEYYVG